MTVAPHKFGGPRGIGALLVRHGIDIHPILHGATQQLGFRPGTESVTLAISFLAALRAWSKDQPSRSNRLAALRDHFETTLQTTFPHIVVNGRTASRLPPHLQHCLRRPRPSGTVHGLSIWPVFSAQPVPPAPAVPASPHQRS